MKQLQLIIALLLLICNILILNHVVKLKTNYNLSWEAELTFVRIYTLFLFFFCLWRWYLTLQGKNSVKSAKHFNHVVLLTKYLASQWSKLVSNCYISNHFFPRKWLVQVFWNFNIFFKGSKKIFCEN